MYLTAPVRRPRYTPDQLADGGDVLADRPEYSDIAPCASKMVLQSEHPTSNVLSCLSSLSESEIF